MPPILCVVGRTGVGKTVLVERLVPELKRRGYRVATIKHDAHGFDIDQPGKDSWRHAQAGADAVVISSPEKVALIQKTNHDASPQELSRLIGPDYDIIVAEGFKRSKGPKIEVHRKETGGELLCNPEELLAVATDEALETRAPQFALEDASGLVDLLERRWLKRLEEGTEEVTLFADGQPVPIKPFVQSFIARTLLGLVSALKRVGQPQSLDISVRRKA